MTKIFKFPQNVAKYLKKYFLNKKNIYPVSSDEVEMFENSMKNSKS